MTIVSGERIQGGTARHVDRRRKRRKRRKRRRLSLFAIDLRRCDRKKKFTADG